MKIHEEIEEWLAAAVTDGLSPEERQNFDEHLATCARCRALHEEQKIMSHAMTNTFQNLRPDEHFEQRIAQKFRRRLAQKPPFSLLAWLARGTPARTVQWALALLLTIALIKGGQVLTGETSGGVAVRDQSETGANVPVLGDIPLLGQVFRKESKESNLAVGGVLPGSAAGEALQSSSDAFFGNGAALGPQGLTLKNGFQGNLATLREEASAGQMNGSAKARRGAESNKQPASRAIDDESAAAPKNEKSKWASNSALTDFDKKQEQPSKDGQLAPQPPLPIPAQPGAERKLIRNAALDFEVKNFDAALESLRTFTNEEQGYIATADSARGANGKIRGTIVVKMRPANLDRFLLKLRALGTLKNQRIGSDDVTKAYFDTDARLRNAKVLEARLLEMLQKNTGKVSDLLLVEKELARVREQIEQMQGELKFWDTQVAYATVTLTLFEQDLNQATAFLLKERANLTLFAPEVEKTYAAAKTEAAAAHAQVLQAKLERDSDGRVSATLSLLLAPDIADPTIARIKALGRVQTFTTQDERVAKDGSSAAEASDTAPVERDPVQFNLVIARDDETRRQTTLTLVTPQVEQSLDAAKSAALAEHAEVVNSNVARDPNGRGTGQLTLRVPAKNYAAALEALKKIGRVAGLAIQRNDRAGDDESGPVLIALTLTSDETPVQRTNLSVLSEPVEEKARALKQAATSLGAEIKHSTFERQSGGVAVANLTFSLPLQQDAAFVERIKQLGKVTNFTVQRSDAKEAANETAPAQIEVRLYSQGDLVPEQNGVWPTLRRTLAQGVAAVLWSVRMIAVALAFVLPWAAGLALLFGIVTWLQRRRP